MQMKTCLWALVMCAGLVAFAGEWELKNAPLSPDPASGRNLGGGALELRAPSRRTCAWWERTEAIDPAKGAIKFTAKAEITPDAAGGKVYNDVMMFVTWLFPKDGVQRKGKFFQRDFIAYTDKVEDGKIVRNFDETYKVPEGCAEIKIEFIAKWHAMTVKLSDCVVAAVEPPKPRLVRCVIANPHQRPFKSWPTVEATIKGRLAQMEATLTNIFANVERPDLILFSEMFLDTGTPCPEKTAEPVPGGPSFELASRYAKKYKTYIAMVMRERSKENTCHNSTFIAGRDGKLVGIYRKVTLTSGEYQMGLLPGDDFKVFELDFGRVGCLTCWDNWFSESAKFVRRKGAEMLLFPLASCAPDHLELTFPARAIDIGIPILIASREGHQPNGIIDRDGTWRVKTFEDGGFAWADLDLNERKRTFWLSVGPGQGDPYELYLDESRPEIYERQEYGPRR